MSGEVRDGETWNRPTVEQQARFGEGEIVTDDEAVETDFSDWDVYEPGPERETTVIEARNDGGLAEDTREQVKEEQREQAALVADVQDDQVTLGGERAAGQSMWGDDR